MRQTPSPVKVSECVIQIEKALRKKPKKATLETLTEEAAPEPTVSRNAQQLLQFDWLKNAEDSDDDFRPPSPNMLCELADFNRRHAKANAAAKSTKSTKKRSKNV